MKRAVLYWPRNSGHFQSYFFLFCKNHFSILAPVVVELCESEFFVAQSQEELRLGFKLKTEKIDYI